MPSVRYAMQASPRALLHCPAPAKLNLFLHITGQRADGYHLLQTVFQLLDYGDTLHFTLRGDGVIHRTTEVAGVPAQDDLIVRAARLLQAATHTSLGADIAIEKHLPLGGGLGGGSSDAATTLMALNHLWKTGLSRAALIALGLQLGADVPFFIFGRNAFAEGIGASLTAVSTPPGWYLVIEPGVSISTSAIFTSTSLTRNTKPVKMLDFSGVSKGFGKNDLQVVATTLFPEVADAIRWLSAYGDARMTGSGACVFCRFEQEHEAKAALEKVPSKWKAWKAKAIAEHPLMQLQH